MFKTELHLHTAGISTCARVSAEDAIDHFIENGYRTVVITNHLCPVFFTRVVPEGMTKWRDMADLYLSDYRAAKAHAGDRLNVLLGMELRLKENSNDYLLYGIDEQFVYDLGNVMDKTHKEMSEYVRNAGALFFQAHPFRNGMTIIRDKYLDGIEAANYAYTHDSRNDVADAWADKFSLLKSYGSDYHYLEHMCGAGILTDTEIKDNNQLLEVLKSQSFKHTDGKQIFDK